MRILILTTFFDSFGGAEYLVKETAEILLKNGHIVTIVSLAGFEKKNSEKSVWKPGKNLFCLNNGPCKIDASVQNFHKLLKRVRPDVVNIWFGQGFMAILTENAQDMGFPTVINILDPWLSHPFYRSAILKKARGLIKIIDTIPNRQVIGKLGELLETDGDTGKIIEKGEIFKKARRVVFCSKDTKRYYDQRYHLNKNQSYLITPFIELDKIEKIRIEKKLNNDHPPVDLVYVGRVADFWKGFDILLRSIKGIDNLTLTIFSRSYTDINYARFMAKKIKVDIKNINFEVNASRPQLLEKMKSADSLIIPSLAEGFSLVMLEAMAVGGTVVAGPMFGGPLDVIKDGYNGYLFKPGDVLSLRKTILEAKESRLKKEITKHAMETAEKFPKRDFVKKLERIYARI